MLSRSICYCGLWLDETAGLLMHVHTWCMWVACECQKPQVTLIGINLLRKRKRYKSSGINLCSILISNNRHMIWSYESDWYIHELLPDYSGLGSWIYYDIYVVHVAGFCGSDQPLTPERLSTFRPQYEQHFMVDYYHLHCPWAQAARICIKI